MSDTQSEAAASRYAYVRTEDAPRMAPPRSEVGIGGWLWRNLFSSMTNFHSVGAAALSITMALATVLVVYLAIAIAYGLGLFAIFDAVWVAAPGLKREACATVQQGGQFEADWFGSCYPYVSAKWQSFIYGRYPDEELWRPNLVFLLGSLGVAWLVGEAAPRRRVVGLVMVALGAAYGLLVASEALYGETFGQRVGVQILIGVGVMYTLAPITMFRRTIGLLMVTVYPVLAFLLLTGGDLELHSSFLWGLGAFALAAYALGLAARFGLLGSAGRVFDGVLRSAAMLALAALAVSFFASSRFVDMVEAAGGATVSQRETQAIDWWSANNRVDTPILASALNRLDIESWGDAEADALARLIAESAGGVWDLERARAAADGFASGLSSVERGRIHTVLERRAAAPPSPRQVAQFSIDTGVVLTEDERARLEAIAWRGNFWGVASAPEARIVWPLPPVETELWGGLLVTLVVAVVGIAFSLPLGIVLALGRRSSLPVVRGLSIVFIEFWRGVPLITVLFMSSVMLPLFLPEGSDFNKLMRALIGVMLFSAAYQAEVVRGGLQAIPKGQFEAAAAIGLGYWPSMSLIVLPQALTLVIPGIVNTFIGLFKDTALVSIIGLFDLLGAVVLSFSDAEWSTPVQQSTGFFMMSLIYFVFCFGMSRYSMYMEHKLRKGHAR